MTGLIVRWSLCVGIIVSGLQAQAQTLKAYYCDQGRQLLKQSLHDELYARYEHEDNQAYIEIANDAKKRFYLSTGVAVAGTALLTWEMSAAAAAAATTEGEMGLITRVILRIPELGNASAGSGAAAVTLTTATGHTVAFSLTRLLSSVLFSTVTINSLPIFIGPMAYVGGRAVYELHSSKGGIDYAIPDVEQGERELHDQITKLAVMRSTLVASPPGWISNSFSFGEANYDHYMKIANTTIVENELRKELVQVERAHAKVLMSNCEE